jgi:hypothetical protein
MLDLNGTAYRVCLLDTNAISEMLKNPQREQRRFFELAFSGQGTSQVPAFSLFTIMEIRQRPRLYEAFLQLFEIVPCLVLKGHEELLSDEMAAYPDPSSVQMVSVVFAGFAMAPESRLNNLLKRVFSTPEVKRKEAEWVAGRASVVEAIRSLVKNYPPERSRYSANELRIFLEVAGFQQVVLRSRSFAQNIVDSGTPFQIDAFPSLKMMLFTVFYKFYAEKRRPSISDAFDLVISAPTPYVDTIITENHQAEVIRKIKRQDSFLDHLEVLTLRDLRS